MGHRRETDKTVSAGVSFNAIFVKRMNGGEFYVQKV